METKQRWIDIIVGTLVLVGLFIFQPRLSLADWQKMDTVPDVDKSAHDHEDEDSCWMASAANMLAAAGYGDGSTVQARADDIYKEMTDHCIFLYGVIIGGWTDEAIEWWLGSKHNTCKDTNSYTICDYWGWKELKPCDPYNLPTYMHDELRDCTFIGLSISWPRKTAGGSADGGHAITCWGDDSGDYYGGTQTKVKVTDSDTDWDGNIQTYTWDSFSNPNPGYYNEGNGWYFNYRLTPGNHAFVKGFITLRSVDNPGGHKLTQRITSSRKIHQSDNISAVSLHYDMTASSDIRSWSGSIDWATNNTPLEIPFTSTKMRIHYNLSDNPVPKCTWVTITSNLCVDYDEVGNSQSFSYSNVYFDYPISPNVPEPGYGETLETPNAPDINSPYICGGYVVGSFDLFSDPCGTMLVSQNRFQCQYSYFQDPESHRFLLERKEDPNGVCFAGNFRFGHTYGCLDSNSLWEFEEWMTEDLDIRPFNLGDSVEINLNWEGQLPYPNPGEYIFSADPNICGAPGTVYLQQDLNYDCYVDFRDFALFSELWLGCTDPNNPACDSYWERYWLNLIAHWKLDEAGRTALDHSGYGNHGILIGDPCWTSGRVGKALFFDGDGDYVHCSNDPIFNITDKITVATWVKTNDSGNDEHNPYVTKGDHSYAIKHRWDNNIEFFIYDANWYAAEFPVDGAFNGLWHHLAGTYDGNEVRLYIDGQLKDTNYHTGSINTDTSNVYIGGNSEFADRWYNGLIDDTRIYNRALSADEVKALFDSY